MDPLPRNVRYIWPMVRIVNVYVTNRLSDKLLSRTDANLRRSGLSFVFSAEEYWAVEATVTIITTFVGGMIAQMAKMDQVMGVLVGLAFGLILPRVWLNDARKRRALDIIKGMPVFLDYLNLCVSAGTNFSGAIEHAVRQAPDGPLKNEFSIVLRDLRSGLPRAEALERMAGRLEIPEITSFVRAVVQAEMRGTSLRDVMAVQAEQRLVERFQRAEQKAMEAPVKLTGPLVMFIFPVTFIVLLYPIFIKFNESGAF